MAEGLVGVREIGKQLDLPTTTVHRYQSEVRSRWRRRDSDEAVESRRRALIRQTQLLQQLAWQQLRSNEGEAAPPAWGRMLLRAIRQEAWLAGMDNALKHDRAPSEEELAAARKEKEAIEEVLAVPEWARVKIYDFLATVQFGNRGPQDGPIE
jgi:hypothetical protein